MSSTLDGMMKNAIVKTMVYEMNERTTALFAYGIDEDKNAEFIGKAIVELFNEINVKHKVFKE